MTGQPVAGLSSFVFPYLLGVLLGLVVFLQIPAFGVEETPRLFFLGAVHMGPQAARLAVGSKKLLPATLGTESLQPDAAPPPGVPLSSEFNGILVGSPSGGGRRLVALANNHSFSFEEPLRAYVPFLGSGFIKYQKVGGLIEYVSLNGEVLWKKDYAAYPYSDPTGKLLLFVSGDANDTILADENGSVIARSSGDLLGHHCFSARALRVGLSFSGTAFRVLDEKGAVLLQWAPKERFFLKSCALSPDGNRAAVHYDAEGADWIAIFALGAGKEPERLARFKLDSRYPHLLSLALEQHGLLVGAPERVLFFDADGDLVWSKKTRMDGFYRPVYAGPGLFAFGVDEDLLFLDGRGRRLARTRLPFGGAAWRIQPGRSRNVFGVQSGSELLFFRLEPTGG